MYMGSRLTLTLNEEEDEEEDDSSVSVTGETSCLLCSLIQRFSTWAGKETKDNDRQSRKHFVQFLVISFQFMHFNNGFDSFM